MDDDLVAALAVGPPVAPYLHLPAQSGSDRILYRMKRRYDAAEYRQTVARVRSAVPEIAMSSDFIVGFPGETDEDFEATLDLVREIRFASLFGFRYSARPGTAAARWGRASEVPEEVAGERLQRLLDLQAQLQRERTRPWWAAVSRFSSKAGTGAAGPRDALPATASCTSRRETAPAPRRIRGRPGGGRPAQLPTRGKAPMVKMEIKGLLMDPVSNMPVVILRDRDDGVFLPIWVGIFEANAIALEMEKSRHRGP